MTLALYALVVITELRIGSRNVRLVWSAQPSVCCSAIVDPKHSGCCIDEVNFATSAHMLNLHLKRTMRLAVACFRPPLLI